MTLNHQHFCLLGALCLLALSACGGGEETAQQGASGGEGTGGAGTGGSTSGGASSGGSTSGGASAGGAWVGAGGSGAGGNGAGGSDECGSCPGFVCQVPLDLRLAADAEAAAPYINGVVATAEGFQIECVVSSSCAITCGSREPQLDSGHYSATIDVPGFVPQVVEFDIENPTNCGCCACCPGSYFETLTLTPLDNPQLQECCADLQRDPKHCGTCGNECEAGSVCENSTCTPTPDR